jgi:ribonucleoside-diphosphate reductase alpha chain
MDASQKILSEVVIFNKYARYEPMIKRRETWEELYTRNMAMHIKKYPMLKDEIKDVYKNYVATKKVLPSMRSMQFGGAPIELSNSRIYNCAFTNADHPSVFAETMFNLLSGAGVGYSVQRRHINQLPIITGVKPSKRHYLVGDSIIGWADAVKMLIKSYTMNKSEVVFDFRDIRPKGAHLITSGGKAPGPDPLRICLDKIRAVLNNAVGRKLSSIEVHDIMCHIADAVLSGGIRRAAMIVLFDYDDMDMLYAKSGNWWELNPQRGRANNSVILDKQNTTEETFKNIWKIVRQSEAGEPGFVWAHDLDSGMNPCAEIGLRSNQYCNLTEVNVSDVHEQDELNRRVAAAAFLGTLQAGYTNFHYLRDIWKKNSEEEALIGVGMTGIASGGVLSLNLKEAANVVKETNKHIANIIGINPAARTTCVKPSGSTSCVLGSSSGIHAWHSAYYIRRMRVGKSEPLYAYLKEQIPELLEDCVFKPHLDAIMNIPQKAPEGSVLRSEGALDLLARVKKFNLEWVEAGHNSGIQDHNVSCTVSIKETEWDEAGEWMWNERLNYTGISVLPYDGHTYQQAPFEECTKEVYESLYSKLKDIDLSQVVEEENNTNLLDQAACQGGACNIV